MSRNWRLGNDVVDLASSRSRDKASHLRFLRKVFTPEEAEAIRSSPSPERTLWLLWAGKEAIFKSTTKVLGAPPVFHHPDFRILFSPEELQRLARETESLISAPTLKGTGVYRGFHFAVRAHWAESHIHALSWMGSPGDAEPEVCRGVVRDGGKATDLPESLRSRFSREEWSCVSHRASALARLEARRELAVALDIQEGRLEIRCGPGMPGRRVPLAYLDGAPLPVDLTLSHDSSLLAWAFLKTPYLPQGR